MPETPRDTDRTEAPVPPTPIAALRTLDLGLPESAIGMVCDIDDPDCVPGVLPGAPASITTMPAMTGGDEA